MHILIYSGGIMDWELLNAPSNKHIIAHIYKDFSINLDVGISTLHVQQFGQKSFHLASKFSA